MNIDHVHIKGLFNDFDHDLSFEDDERIMLLTGPNGSGKTTILKLLDIIFNQSFTRLCEIPFQEIGITFDNNKRLVLERIPESNLNSEEQLPLKLIFHWNDLSEEFNPSRVSIDPDNLEFPISAIEDIIPVLDRVDYQEWINIETGSSLTFMMY